MKGLIALGISLYIASLSWFGVFALLCWLSDVLDLNCNVVMLWALVILVVLALVSSLSSRRGVLDRYFD